MSVTHLYENIRIKIAQDYLKQELRKLHKNIKKANVWKNLDKSIENWSPQSIGLREFWNGFWGIAMGFKLKVGLLDIITAKNISWEIDKDFPINELSTVGFPYIHKNLAGNQNIETIKKFLEKNEHVQAKWVRDFKAQSQDSFARDNFPLIVEERDEYFSIYDGNRRFFMAVAEGKETMSAYVGKYQTKEKTPVDFWVPTPLMMELFKHLKQNKHNKKIYKNYINILSYILGSNKLGYSEFTNRVLNEKEPFYKKIREDIELSLEHPDPL